MIISLKVFVALALFFSEVTPAPVDRTLVKLAELNSPQQNKPGLAYSPYNDDGTCKTRSQVFADINSLKDFSVIRSYGTSCDQVHNIMDAARPLGIKVVLGIYDIFQSDAAIGVLIRSVNGNWNMVESVSIGNEHVQNGQIGASAMADKLNSARYTLRAAGFNGPVVTIDTFDAVIRNPVLCQTSDYAAVNIHPWFDWNTAAKDAGAFLANQINRVAIACPGKNVRVTETGWPYRGDTHGKAVASRANQEIALHEMYRVTGNLGIFLGPFDDGWKSDNGGTFGSEKFWGISNFAVFT